MLNDRFVLSQPMASDGTKRSFVSRAGRKLEAALMTFPIDVTGKICADLGANVGGFTDCLLQFGAAKVHSVDTAYGVLAWTLRKDSRVVVHDRTNALHLKLPEVPALVAIDVGWTRQQKILPVVMGLLGGSGSENRGDVLTLIKPHYESQQAKVQRGVLTSEQSEQMLEQVMEHIVASGWTVGGIVKSPIEGQKGNSEYIAWLKPGNGGSGMAM